MLLCGAGGAELVGCLVPYFFFSYAHAVASGESSPARLGELSHSYDLGSHGAGVSSQVNRLVS